MKKKNLQNLKLHKHKISNLSLLYTKKGGTFTTDTATETVGNPDDPYETIVAGHCQTLVDKTMCGNFTDCATNGGDTKAPPPTEYETCAYHNPGFGR